MRFCLTRMRRGGESKVAIGNIINAKIMAANVINVNILDMSITEANPGSRICGGAE